MSKASDSREQVLRANQDFHDRFAEHYETYYNDVVFFEENQQRIRNHLEDLRSKVKGDVHLDLGCGTGNIGRLASDLFSTRIGVDISEKSLEIARPHYQRVLQADIFNLKDVEDESVDLVTGYSLLHHLREPTGLFPECHRVLKPGGWIYFDNDPNSAYFVFSLMSYVPQGFLNWIESAQRRENPNPANTVIDQDPEAYKTSEFHHHFGSRYEGFFPGQIRAWLERAGFRDVDINVFQIHRRKLKVKQVPLSFFAKFRHSQMCVKAHRD